MDTIFVSIAAYRDPQLVPTIEDCLARASHPERLRFGICHQRGPEEQRLPWADDPRFRVLDVDWRESRGACWARAEVMKLYAGERYYLQLDSHHRFVDAWDERALDQLNRTGSPRPVLTSCAPAFHPDRPDAREPAPLQMNFDRFSDEVIVQFRPVELTNWRTRTKPARARFACAHFLLTIGDFVRDVPYDPDLYFYGEEITLAIRAFSHGYDLFHPVEALVWHEYIREQQRKHWTDHTRDNGIEVAWYLRDRLSLDKVRQFLESPRIGRFGLGTARTMADYQSYAGIDFRRRRAQEYTRLGEEPPNPPAPADWAERVVHVSLDVTLDRSRLAAATDDHRFWYFGVHDDTGNEIYRQDLDRAEIDTVVAAPSTGIVIHREFDTERTPAGWTVWPSRRDGTWLERIDGDIALGRPPVTLVTALMDIGRNGLSEPFARSFNDHYLVLFERLLQIRLPMVIHVEPGHEALVWRHRSPEDTRVVFVQPADLEVLPWFGRTQEIRLSRAWRRQAEWLEKSPLAALAHYGPLVLSKMHWLGEVARHNPLATPGIFWVDVGLLSTVPEVVFTTPVLASRLLQAAGDFLWVEYPRRDEAEIGGFPCEALARRAGVAAIDRRTKGAFFGGRAECVADVAERYDRELAETLELGLMGTEESLYTILAHRHAQEFTRYSIDAGGLMTPFFVNLVRARS